MKQIIKQRQIVADDWQHLDEDADPAQLPAAKLIVPLAFWREHRDSLAQHQAPLALKLEPDDDVDAIPPQLSRFAMVVLQFPSFRDGRAYSQARMLRLHHGYEGDIRASGNVLRDQLMYMERVGFTSFEVDSKQAVNEALKAFDEIKVKYQACSDEPLPLYKRRTA
ncbi:hypothetical protein Tel_05385 [Candidatus Tenderia electrophaga]|jgi:uncharacterized protein (DUF934 family)|uniref:Oxidoreductase n=1 Tax=Candidatus Tenderia electrophaga TaxID=1748243 RepID=A0A0S2TBT9_9GAMM|nr:hypothetical protein Tel_05385 [Candidatus Tenderia electrophaga]